MLNRRVLILTSVVVALAITVATQSFAQHRGTVTLTAGAKAGATQGTFTTSDAIPWKPVDPKHPAMEIAFAALFVVPATMKLGFILASCYFAGAIATELSHETLKVNPFIPIALLWIGAFIRDRSILF